MASSSSPAPSTENAAAPHLDGAPIAPSLLASLRHMLFGMDPNPQDVERWHQQAFRFSEAIPWGLIQTVGGPCGILAPVQAFVLHDLIFNRNAAASAASPVVSDAATSQAALISALANILMMCRGKSDSGVTLAIGPPESPRLVFLAFDSEPALRQRIQTVLSTPSMVAALHAEGAVLDFVYSALITRGVERVRDDMDDSSIPLVARFGHCSQELVNLMVVGEAVTNVFDGNKTLAENPEDPTAFFLHGISHQGEIGFLTVLEALRYSKVGAFLKAPKFPIWVVGSSSHYTVLFSRDVRINQVSARQQRLDKMRVHFQQLDPHEQGFIPAAELSTLLDSLKLTGQVDIFDLRKACDPDHLGIIVWDRFHQAVTKALDNPPADWNCGACTYKNAANRSRCEICDTAAPPKDPKAAAATKPAAADQKDVDIQAFPLFHYNGLEGTRLVPQCSMVQVTLLGQGVGLDALSSSQGLRDVIQTRWPDALVDYDGPDPRIT